jgi:HD-like signal output (HDOD) protein
MAEQPQTLQQWLAFLTAAEIPVLRHTAREIERLKTHEEDLGARAVANVVVHDPLMTLKLLRYLQDHKRSSQLRELVQVEQAIMMVGLDNFFDNVPHAPVAEDVLDGHKDALLRLLRSVRQAQRAARYAFDWALLLHDLHAEEVRIAALLSYVAEMLMWVFNPEPMLKIRRMQDQDPSLRSATVQEAVLGFGGLELQRELTLAWNLPQLLQDMMDQEHSEKPRVRNVMLAINLARHSAAGWDNPALSADYEEIAALLRMKPEDVQAMLVPRKEAPEAKAS